LNSPFVIGLIGVMVILPKPNKPGAWNLKSGLLLLNKSYPLDDINSPFTSSIVGTTNPCVLTVGTTNAWLLRALL
jgi:hypothetical protein